MLNRRPFVLTGAAALGAACTSGAARAAGTLRVEDRFTVLTAGAGPDVIFIPGLTCGRDVWNPVVAGLGGRYRIHLVQVAGFDGQPARGNASGDVCAGVAEGLAGYIARAGLERPAVVGHSMGGTIGMMLAARHPASAGRLMVVDMFPNMSAVIVGPHASHDAVVAAADGIGNGMAHADDASYRRSLEGNMNRMMLTANGRPAVVEMGMRSDRAVAGRAMREIIVTDLRPELPRITAPVTVVYAWNGSEPFNREAADAFIRAAYAGLPHARFVRIDGAAHFVWVDQPQPFEAALQSFLAG